MLPGVRRDVVPATVAVPAAPSVSATANCRDPASAACPSRARVSPGPTAGGGRGWTAYGKVKHHRHALNRSRARRVQRRGRGSAARRMSVSGSDMGRSFVTCPRAPGRASPSSVRALQTRPRREGRIAGIERSFRWPSSDCALSPRADTPYAVARHGVSRPGRAPSRRRPTDVCHGRASADASRVRSPPRTFRDTDEPNHSPAAGQRSGAAPALNLSPAALRNRSHPALSMSPESPETVRPRRPE